MMTQQLTGAMVVALACEHIWKHEGLVLSAQQFFVPRVGVYAQVPTCRRSIRSSFCWLTACLLNSRDMIAVQEAPSALFRPWATHTKRSSSLDRRAQGGHKADRISADAES